VYNPGSMQLRKLTEGSVILVIPDDTAIEYAHIPTALTEGKDAREVVTKKEPELTETDLNSVLILIGPYYEFKRWPEYELPFQLIENGVALGDIYLTDPLDSYVYYTDSLTTPGRILFSGNSEEAFRDYASAFFNISHSFNFIAKKIRRLPALAIILITLLPPEIIKANIMNCWKLIISSSMFQKLICRSIKKIAYRKNYSDLINRQKSLLML
ncbi:MAG: hypothetical protein LUE93_07000, partial [Bacteroides sp.]|nr:hypothetical protein [Bacteroides sp.]